MNIHVLPEGAFKLKEVKDRRGFMKKLLNNAKKHLG
jgi:hypothetical protein